MTLTTHAIVGAAAARLFSFNPIAAFCAAMASHYLIDAIPHWDYPLRSATEDRADPLKSDISAHGKDFYIDLLKVLFDAAAGLAISYVLFQPATAHDAFIVVAGAVGGILPDPLQFAYFKIRRQPFTALQRFHYWMHADLKLEGRWVSGGVMQIAICFTAVFISLAVR